MKKILITGGAGFIGSNLALKLISDGYSVTVLDSLSRQIHGVNPETESPLYNSIKDRVKFIHGDVCNKEKLADAIKGQDAIFHLAAETGTGQSMYEINKYFEVNVQGTANLLDILGNTEHMVKKILISSSRSIYGEGKYIDSNGNVVYPPSRLDEDMLAGRFNLLDQVSKQALTLVATDEDSLIHPISVYGMTKHYQEDMIMKVAPTLGIIPVAVRYQNVYGPGQSLSNPYTGILAVFSTSILNGNNVEVFEDGLETRDFVYIDDVVDATIAAMFQHNGDHQVFNVGTGVATSVKYIAEKLIELYSSNVIVNVTGRYRVGDIRHNYADISKISNYLGFSPTIDFDTGLSNFASWVKTQKIQKDGFEKSIIELKSKGLFKG